MKFYPHETTSILNITFIEIYVVFADISIILTTLPNAKSWVMRVRCPAVVIREHSASRSSTDWTGRRTWRRHSVSSTSQWTVEVRPVEALASNTPCIDEPVAQKSPTSSLPSGLLHIQYTRVSRPTHQSVIASLPSGLLHIQHTRVSRPTHQSVIASLPSGSQCCCSRGKFLSYRASSRTNFQVLVLVLVLVLESQVLQIAPSSLFPTIWKLDRVTNCDGMKSGWAR